MRLIKRRPPSLGDKLKRLIWRIIWAIPRHIAIPWHYPRILVLRLFGARIGSNSSVYHDVDVWAPWNLILGDNAVIGPRAVIYNVAGVFIGAHSVVSQGAHICTASHDPNSGEFDLVVGEIIIGENCWIAADAFVMPGIKLGDSAVVGARSVVTKNVPERAIYAGNPAAQIGVRSHSARNRLT